MQDAILSIFQTYTGLACLAPVIYFGVYRIAVKRYGGGIARDIRRLLAPALGLLLLAAPLMITYPFLGFVILGLWMAYDDHGWNWSVDEKRKEKGAEDDGHHGWLKSLLGRDDSPFDR